MRMPNGQPGPPTLKAAITGTQTGSTDGVRLSLAPGDTTGPSAVVRETAPGQLAWAMSCLDGPGRPCRQLVVLLVEAQPSTTDRKLRLAVTGDLQYPTFVPTPGWSSFDLDLRPVGDPDGMGPNPVADGGGTVDLAMDRPVVVVPVHVEYGAAPASAGSVPPATLRLVLQAERLTETAPAGLDAPGARPGDGPRRGRDGGGTAGCPTGRGADDLVAHWRRATRPASGTIGSRSSGWTAARTPTID